MNDKGCCHRQTNRNDLRLDTEEHLGIGGIGLGKIIFDQPSLNSTNYLSLHGSSNSNKKPTELVSLYPTDLYGVDDDDDGDGEIAEKIAELANSIFKLSINVPQ